MNKNFFINLVPSVIKTNKWKSFFNVLEDVFKNDIDRDSDDKFLNKYNYKFQDESNLRDLLYKNGSVIPAYTGYTSTINYLQRRVYSSMFEILYRNSNIAYKYILRSYYLYGSVIPLRKTTKGYLGFYENGLTSQTNLKSLVADREKPIIQYYIGSQPFPENVQPTGETMLLADTYLDEFGLFPITSDFEELRDYSNIMMIDMIYNFVENRNDFLSEGSVRSLYELIDHYKKMKLIVRYQPSLNIKFNYNNTHETKYKDFNNEYEVSQMSIHHSDTFQKATKIQLGTGKHFQISDSVNGVQIKIYEKSILDNYLILRNEPNEFFIENIKLDLESLTDDNGNQILYFSEIALLDDFDNVLFYCYFPNIIFYYKMITSMRFYFSFV